MSEIIGFELPNEDNKDVFPIPLETEHFPPPCGMRNEGNTCYSNGLLQSLFSCSSIRRTLNENIHKENYGTNIVMSTLTKVYNEFDTMVKPLPDADDTKLQIVAGQMKAKAIAKTDTTGNVYSFTGDIWRALEAHRLALGKTMLVRGSQEDATEMFMFLSDIFEDTPELENLLLHEYNVSIYCHKSSCRKWVSNVVQEENSFALDPDLSTPQLPHLSKLDKNPAIEGDLANYIMKRSGYVEDFNCPSCQSKEPRYLVYRIVAVPTIIFVYSKTYFEKKNVNFPAFFRIPAKKVNRDVQLLMRFEPVAQIQHVGNRSGGHYWAVARRANPPGFSGSDWWILDDNKVSHNPNGFSPDRNTYCVIYHYIGNEVMKSAASKPNITES